MGLLFTAVQASHCSGLFDVRAQALGRTGSVVVVPGLLFLGMWDPPRLGSNLCPFLWKISVGR